MTTVRESNPAPWRLIIANRGGNIITMLDHRATDRRFNFTLEGPATHTGLVPSDDPEINLPYLTATNPPFLSHNTRLLWGLRREIGYGTEVPWTCRYGGIVMQIEDVAADTPTSRYVAYDPWQWLFKRPVRRQDGSLPGRNGVAYENARGSAMAYDLITNTIALDGDIALDVDPALTTDSPVILGWTVFERGMSVGAALQQLVQTGTVDILMRPIYDPIAIPGKVCELVITPLAGSIRHEAVFAWDLPGRNIAEASYMTDGTELENVVIGYAGAGGQPVPAQEDATSKTRYGEYWGQAFLSGEQDSADLVALAALAQMYIRRNGLRSLSFSPAPEYSLVPLRDYGLGDYVPVWWTNRMRDELGIDYPAFDPDHPGASGYQRIFEIPIELDDNGVEHVRGIRTSTDVPGG